MKLPEEYSTKITVSGFTIFIEQSDDSGYPQTIMINSRERAKAVIKAIREAMNQMEEGE